MDTFQTFVTQENDGVALVTVQGQITAETASSLSEAFHTVLAEKPDRVIIDLAGSSYIASAGIGALVSFLRKMKENGSELSLRAIRPEVRQLFKVTQLDRVFTIVE